MVNERKEFSRDQDSTSGSQASARPPESTDISPGITGAQPTGAPKTKRSKRRKKARYKPKTSWLGKILKFIGIGGLVGIAVWAVLLQKSVTDLGINVTKIVDNVDVHAKDTIKEFGSIKIDIAKLLERMNMLLYKPSHDNK